MVRAATGTTLDIVQRAKGIVLAPAAEWRAIEPESGDTAYLFLNYVAILAAIPPVCEFLRRILFGWRGPRFGFHHVHHGFFGTLFGAVLHWLAAFVIVYAMAIIIDGLAPTFSGQKNQQNAMKLAVYSMTPAWLAGVFALDPRPRVPSPPGAPLRGLSLLARPADPDEAPAGPDGPVRARGDRLRDRALGRRRRGRRARRLGRAAMRPNPFVLRRPLREQRASKDARWPPFETRRFAPLLRARSPGRQCKKRSAGWAPAGHYHPLAPLAGEGAG